MIGLQRQALPIEVKAGATGSMKSLHQFMGEKGGNLAIRFDANLPADCEIEATIQKGKLSKAVSYRLLSLPVYLVERLDEVVSSQVRY